MATTPEPVGADAEERPDVARRAPAEGGRATLRALRALRGFWAKVNNDWLFNLAGLLAYTLLVSAFPVVLTLLALAGFAVGAISPAVRDALVRGIVGALPPGVGEPLVRAALDRLARDAGAVLAFGVASAFFLGSRLFVVLENCFDIIFRVRPRDPLRQNVMALLMMLLYLALLPLIYLAPTVSDVLGATLWSERHAAGARLAARVVGVVASLAAAFLLFGATYVVVPNRPMSWRRTRVGALVGAGLLVLYKQLFPIYQARVLAPSNPGSIIGLILIIVIFFYYAAFILLLGAEVTSWAMGQRASIRSIPTLLHEDIPAATSDEEAGGGGRGAGGRAEEADDGSA